MNENVLIPTVTWNEYTQKYDGIIEERVYETMYIVYAWHIRESESPFEVLEAVTAQWVRMTSNMIHYHLEHHP